MAFSGKSEQRAALSTNYAGGESTLTSASVKGPKEMGDSGSRKLIGQLTSKSGGKSLYGRQDTGTPSGLAGKMSGAGFPDGPKWKRATEPGNLKPGKDSQKNNTTRMKSGDDGDGSNWGMKTTSSKPKALKGGR